MLRETTLINSYGNTRHTLQGLFQDGFQKTVPHPSGVARFVWERWRAPMKSKGNRPYFWSWHWNKPSVYFSFKVSGRALQPSSFPVGDRILLRSTVPSGWVPPILLVFFEETANGWDIGWRTVGRVVHPACETDAVCAVCVHTVA